MGAFRQQQQQNIHKWSHDKKTTNVQKQSNKSSEQLQHHGFRLFQIIVETIKWENTYTYI